MRFWLVRLGSIAAAISFCFLIDPMGKVVLPLLGAQYNDYWQRLIVLAGLYITLAVSLNLINGITGQFSIGHAAFYQIGAYTAGYLSVCFYQRAPLHGLLWLGLMVVVGAIAAGVAGFVVGLPSLRLKGDYLAIVTLGFGEIIRIIVQNTKEVGGAYGMNVAPKFTFVWVVWLLAVLCIAVCRNLLKTAHGLPYLAVREDEVASAAMGVNVTGVKVSAFVIGSMFAGAAGALLAHFEGFITPATFAMDVSFIVLTMVILGGTGSITGTVFSAALLSYLPEWLRGLKDPTTHDSLVLTGNSVVAGILAVIVFVAILKKYGDVPTKFGGRVGLFAGSVAVAGIVKVAFTYGLALIPPMAAKHVEVGQLRMLIFSMSLIVVMLLRPQGIFAHHEFSWSWVRKALGSKDAPHTAVSS